MERKKSLYSVVLYCNPDWFTLLSQSELYPENCDPECKYYVHVLFFFFSFQKPSIMKAIYQFRRVFIFGT